MDLSHNMESPTGQQQQNMTVTKYQNYVEVSKPFEMADFYKYSEKLRRQRVGDSPGPNRLQSPTPHSGAGGQGQTQSSRSNQPYMQSQATSPVPHQQAHAYGSMGRHATQDSYSARSEYNVATTSRPYPGDGVAPAEQQQHQARSPSPYDTAASQHISSYQAPLPMTCDALPQPRSKNTPSISSQRIV